MLNLEFWVSIFAQRFIDGSYFAVHILEENVRLPLFCVVGKLQEFVWNCSDFEMWWTLLYSCFFLILCLKFKNWHVFCFNHCTCKNLPVCNLQFARSHACEAKNATEDTMCSRLKSIVEDLDMSDMYEIWAFFFIAIHF